MTQAMRFSRAALVAGALAACANGAVGPPFWGSYHPSMLRYAAARGAIYTEIVGNPFAVPEDELARVVTGAMRGAPHGPPVSFSTERDPDNPSPYRVVVVFNPAPGVGAQGLCRTPPRSSGPAADALRVLAVFCGGSHRETSVRGRMSGATRPGDAALRSLIHQMTAQLFPARNPNLHDGGRDDFDL